MRLAMWGIARIFPHIVYMTIIKTTHTTSYPEDFSCTTAHQPLTQSKCAPYCCRNTISYTPVSFACKSRHSPHLYSLFLNYITDKK